MTIISPGIPFTSVNIDLLILFIGFLFLELAYKLFLDKKHKEDIIFSKNTSEVEKTLWFLISGFLLYVISIPSSSLIIYYLTSNNILSSIVFQYIKPDLLGYFLNLGALIQISNVFITPIFFSILLIFILIMLVIVINLYLKHRGISGINQYSFLIYSILSYGSLLILFLMKLNPLISVPILVLLIIFLIIFLIFIPKIIPKAIATAIALILVLVVFLIFIHSYTGILQQKATVTSYNTIKNGGYVLSGTPNDYLYLNGTAYQNLTIYNITPLFLNISSRGANFIYFRLYRNITSVNNINNLIKSYALPGYTYNPLYSCAYSNEFTCTEMNVPIENTTIPYVIIKDISSPKINPLIPLELGPLNPNEIDKIVNVTKPTYACNKSLCEINFSITNKANASISVDSLTIPANYQEYNLSNASVRLNSVNSECFKMIPGYKIECNGNDNEPTSFISRSYNSQGISIISISLIPLPPKSHVNITIALNIAK
ncbi:MAG: hypothetical protein ACP5U0_09115 [Caldisphaera sp.]